MTVESGIQNTGIAIFMLKFSLEQPAADITTGNIFWFFCFLLIVYNFSVIYIKHSIILVIPVAVALMTPIPLLIAFLIKKCFGKKDQITENQDPATESMLNESQGTLPKVEKGSVQAWIVTNIRLLNHAMIIILPKMNVFHLVSIKIKDITLYQSIFYMHIFLYLAYKSQHHT